MVSIPTKLKQFIILVIIFSLIYWFQHIDDIKRCKERKGIYNKIKLPLLVTAIVGLVIFWNQESVPSTNEAVMIVIPEIQDNFIRNNNTNTNSNFDVYTGLPEF
jgi:hypothetical protein